MYKNITGHWGLNTKISLIREPQYVYGGHLTELTQVVNYSNVISWYMLCIILNIEEINDLDVRFLYIVNNHLKVETDQKL